MYFGNAFLFLVFKKHTFSSDESLNCKRNNLATRTNISGFQLEFHKKIKKGCSIEVRCKATSTFYLKHLKPRNFP